MDGVLTHIVVFHWIGGVAAERVEKFRAALDGLALDLKSLVTIRHGPDLRFREGNGDYALVATFSDKESWQAYQAHPKHKDFVKSFVEPIQARRTAIQF